VTQRASVPRSPVDTPGYPEHHPHNHLSQTGLDGPRLPVTMSPRLHHLSDGELAAHVMTVTPKQREGLKAGKTVAVGLSVLLVKGP
jgi:hypothetical protein